MPPPHKNGASFETGRVRAVLRRRKAGEYRADVTFTNEAGGTMRCFSRAWPNTPWSFAVTSWSDDLPTTVTGLFTSVDASDDLDARVRAHITAIPNQPPKEAP